MTAPKTIVVGLDGAGFELLDPWIDAGELPNVARVVESGVTGNLESVLPPVTSPNWKAYATGKNPGKLGIFWWENVDVANGRVHYPDGRKDRHTEFWEYLAEDEPACVVGVPTTHPPAEMDGAVVAGAPDAPDSGYTSPPELEGELRDRLGYRVAKRHRLKDDVDRAAAEIHDLIDLRFRAARYLLEAYDPAFLQVTTFYINSLHHYLWDHEHTLRGWRTVDEHVGAFLDAGHNVVLMSDHGSNPIETVFNVNTWLERRGYLALDTGLSALAYRAGLNTDRLVRWASALGVRDPAGRLAPEWLLDHLPDESGEFKRSSKTDNVDWAASRALASGQGPVYVLERADESARRAIREDLLDGLDGLTDEAGRPIADDVHRAEDVYDGPYVAEGPDVLIDQAEGVHVAGGIGREAVFDAPSADGWAAENERWGLFAATGPAFSDGTVDGLSILDLAPTLLHLHGRAVPEDMDGRVRRDVFAPDSEPRDRPVRHVATSPREAERRRIRRVARRLEL